MIRIDSHYVPLLEPVRACRKLNRANFGRGQMGYSFLDCAQFYGNEAAVGEAIRESGIPREKLYLASKVWCDNIHEGKTAVRAQLQKTLRDLGTSYLNLYLIHWPVPTKHVAAYQALEELQEEGLVRSIGVSNYTKEDYEELMAVALVPPAVNQIEANPFLYRKNTIDFFQRQGCTVQAYRPLQQGKALQDMTVVDIATKHGRAPAQVLGRWCVQKGLIYLPKTLSTARMVENARVFDWALGEEDMQMLDALTTGEALQAFKELYMKCVCRDTPLDGNMDNVKTDVTID